MIDDLKAFVAALEEASLTKAAQRLCLTQSAVSRRIQQLEEHLGATLLDRASRPLTPTPLGKRVYEQALSALRLIEALSSLSRADAEPSGLFRIGITHALGEMLTVHAVKAIRGRYHQLDLRLRSEWSAGLRDDVARGELDAAVVLMPLTGKPMLPVVGETVATLDMAIVQSRSQPLIRGRTRMSALVDQGWILNPHGCGYRAALESAIGVADLRVVVDLFGAEMQLRMIAAGFGLGVMPRKLLRELDTRRGLVAVDVSDFSLKLDVWVIHGLELGNLQAPVHLLAEVMKSAAGTRPKATGR